MSSGSLKACLHPDQERKEGRDAVVRNVGRQLPERCHPALSPHRKFLVQLPQTTEAEKMLAADCSLMHV